MRKLITFESLDEPVLLRIKTKSPSKWLLIDRETGQAYQGNSGGYWDRLDPILKDTPIDDINHI